MSEHALLAPPAPAAPRTGAGAPSLADLVLLRLLPEKGSVAPKRLRADLAVFFGRPPGEGQLRDALAALRAEGFVGAKAQRATDAGRARAMQFLGVETLPPRTNWRAIKAKYLVPSALGLPPDAAAAGKADKLAALLLQRKLGLPAGAGDALARALEAVACRALGFPNCAALRDLLPLALAKAIGSEHPLGAKQGRQVLPRVLLKAPRGGIDGLREVALGDWLGGSPPVEPSEEPFDLEAFANTVKAEARRCPTGRFGRDKVFISHVWNALRDEPRFAPLGLGGFKQRLVEANRGGLLALARADLVQLMDPADVRESEAAYLTATFHFILSEG